MGDELVHAVRGVTLDVARGDYVAIVGPSGCGKSTLLNLLGGIDRPTAGSVTIDGARIDQHARRASDAVPPATHRIRLSALLSHAGAHGDRERRAADGRGEAAAASSALSARASCWRTSDSATRRDHRPAQLSGGEQQRVAIARALANRPAVLARRRADRRARRADRHRDDRAARRRSIATERRSSSSRTTRTWRARRSASSTCATASSWTIGGRTRHDRAARAAQSRTATVAVGVPAVRLQPGRRRDDRAAVDRRGAARRSRATRSSSAAATSPCCPRASTSK